MARPQNRRNPGPREERISRVYELAALEGLSYSAIAKRLGVSKATVGRAMLIAIKTIPEMDRAAIRRTVAERNRFLWERGVADLNNGHPPNQMLPILLQINAQAAKLFGLNEEQAAANITIQAGGVTESALAAAVEEARLQEQEILARDRDG